MPANSTVRSWQASREDVASAIARDDGEDALAAECLSIADNAEDDYRFGPKSRSVEADSVARSKLRIWTRMLGAAAVAATAGGAVRRNPPQDRLRRFHVSPYARLHERSASQVVD